MQPASDSESPSTRPPDKYFTGSDRAEDYFIDLTVKPEHQPLDIQAYLECIAFELRGQGLPNDSPYDDNGGFAPYVPRLDVVAEGLDALRAVSQTKEHGLWIDPSDVTTDDMASSTFGHNPWLATLYRTARMEAAAAAVEAYDDEPWSYKAVVYGNVRIAFPTALFGPYAGSWLDGTCNLYGRSHPVALLAEPQEDKYDDGYDDEYQDAKPKPEPEDLDVMVQMRYALCEAGLGHTSEPVLPVTPYLQEWFERDPEGYHEMIGREAERGAPMYHAPVGYAEWCEKYNEENARRRTEERGTNGLNSDDANT